jgi:hypothetical protein
MSRIISSTVDIVRRCEDALRLSKDYFGRCGKLVTVLEAKERMFCDQPRTCYRVNDLRWLTTVAAGAAVRLTDSHLLAERPLPARSAIDW